MTVNILSNFGATFYYWLISKTSCNTEFVNIQYILKNLPQKLMSHLLMLIENAYGSVHWFAIFDLSLNYLFSSLTIELYLMILFFSFTSDHYRMLDYHLGFTMHRFYFVECISNITSYSLTYLQPIDDLSEFLHGLMLEGMLHFLGNMGSRFAPRTQFSIF